MIRVMSVTEYVLVGDFEEWTEAKAGLGNTCGNYNGDGFGYGHYGIGTNTGNGFSESEEDAIYINPLSEDNHHT